MEKITLLRNIFTRVLRLVWGDVCDRLWGDCRLVRPRTADDRFRGPMGRNNGSPFPV